MTDEDNSYIQTLIRERDAAVKELTHWARKAGYAEAAAADIRRNTLLEAAEADWCDARHAILLCRMAGGKE